MGCTSTWVIFAGPWWADISSCDSNVHK